MIRKTTLLIAFLAQAGLLSAQKFNFKNFSVGEGLTQSEIYAICEDKDGHLWLGTNGGGVIRYDGFRFKGYREEEGLKSNFVTALSIDHMENLWVGTDAGLCKFNGTGFVYIDDESGPRNSKITALLKDFENNLWIGTADSGIYKYDGTCFRQPGISAHLPAKQVNCLFEDSRRNIWIGTSRGAVKYANQNTIVYSRNEGLPSNLVNDIAEDDHGSLWFATSNSGVSCLKDSVFINYNQYDGLGSNTVFTVYNDRAGSIWFGTSNGVTRFDGLLFRTFGERYGLANNVVVSIHKDFTNNMWFGTSGGGLSRLDNERFVHYLGESDRMGKSVYSVIQSPNGNMIFGTSSGGITIFNGRNYRLLNRYNGFTSSKVRVLHFSSDSSLWIGTGDEGAFKYNRQGFRHYPANKGLVSNAITAITSDTAGNIWFASPDSGICILDKKNSEFHKIKNIKGIAGNTVYSLAPDLTGNIWAGYSNGSLVKLSYVCNDSLPGEIYFSEVGLGTVKNSIRTVITDCMNNVIAGTAGGGLYIYNGSKFVQITRKDGLSSDNIYLLIFDSNKNLWAGSEMGLDRITFGEDFTVAELKHYGINEGFKSVEVYRNSCCMDKEGNLWFGTVNGATIYNPAEDIPVNILPRLSLTGIKLFFDDIKNTPYADTLTGLYQLPLHLELPHNKNSLTFEFTGIYHRNPGAVRYKIMLEGSDNNWSPPTNRQEVTYAGLMPGDYTFKVIACNEDGRWTVQPVTFSFTILAPFWQAWWFRVLVILVFLLIFWLIVYSRIRKIKLKNKIENEKLEMEKNIIELEQEAARLQMNPHFIFNSLNSIQGFISTSDTSQAKHYLAKFARLMRMVLENSREELIPLENEVEILENYLRLEKLNANDRFDYTIKIDDEINSDQVEIPPMMIQPFVENAIIHGLRKKEEKGLVEISFRRAGRWLMVEIKDNGIGRAQSQINKPSAGKHKSTGMSVTAKRLEQLEKQSGSKTGIQITDLTDDNGAARGTAVELTIPVEAWIT
ncbi:MAG: histidine kinase [Bacteroidales bacterium]|nr:histidine kinase [Bacteroidales bacterium]